MPRETRSRSRSPKRGQQEAPIDAPPAGAASEGNSSGSSGSKVPLEQAGAAAASAEYHASTPEARPRENSSSSSRSRPGPSQPWEQERRDHRDGARGDSSIFASPAYKTDRYAHPSHHREPTPGSMMDHATRRDFDQLDLNEDFTGPEDPLLLGSFSEESPPRLPPGGRSPSLERQPASERKRPASAGHQRRPSPPPHPYAYQQSYSASRSSYGRSGREEFTPSQGGRGPPPGYQYSGYPPQASPPSSYSRGPRSSPRYYSGYSPYQYPPERYWDAPSGPYPHDYEDDIPPPPPSSGKKRSPPADHPHSPQATPEKPIKARSPFRSPPTSKQKYKRSPDFAAASPYFGTHGSFGMDTPSATLGAAEFSPMGPALEEFDENAPLPLGGDLGLGRSNSQDSATPVIRRRTVKEESSPLTGFMNELSPFEGLHGIARSPVVQPGFEDPPSHERAKPVTASGARSGESRMHSTIHGSVKKALWPRTEGPSSSTPGRVRLEIGSAGALSTRKSLEGINTMMHPRHSGSTPSRHEAYGRGPAPPPHHRGPPHSGAYRGEMATPIKSSGYHSRPTPSGMHRPPYPGSASKYGHGPPSHHKDYPGSSTKPRYGPPSSMPSSTGKENNKKMASPKKTPCNCKKSKCLKLYCECFAALEFCKDCNCSDCGNTPTAGAMRDKAIKDTRAKNANAFKPRFSGKGPVVDASPQTGHNMGCRCKRSECLKKYCECFQAGVICGTKCKCVDCLNFAGSQALIDKRRKIKDQRGADFAMRVADEAWKQGRPGGPPPRKPAAPAAAGAAGGPPPPRGPPAKSPPTMSHMPPPHMMHPSPRGPPPQHGGPHGPPPHHMGQPHGHPHPGAPHPGPHGHPYHPYHHAMPPHMRGPPPGYPHMGMPMTPAGYPPHPGGHPRMHESPHGMYPPHPGPPASAQRKPDLKRPPPTTSQPKQVTPVAASTPRTPGVRVEFDPASSRKKRKISPGQDEATIPFFGMRFPAQPKTTALAIFSFLSNDDLYNAGLVCKSWSQLAMDEELWKFEA